MSNSDLALSIMLGIGLAAATGFRVFLPMLVVSVAGYTGSLPLGEGFAVLAGVIVSAATMTDLPPMMKWTAAIVAGGGTAGIVHGLTAAVRAKSTVFTAGFGNSAVATAELGGALFVSLLALAAPLAAFVIVVLMLWLAIRLIRRLRRAADRTEPAK
jgi:Domain of unknown function (DUF4126)